MSHSLELHHVAFRVPDLARSLDFYVGKLGFAMAHQNADRAELSVRAGAESILTLHEDRAAPTPARDAAGLFHAALLFPNRGALGAWLQQASQHNVEFDGFSDHAVSEAIYFSDPDGNGLEFYADRPRETWPMTGDQVEMVTAALDLRSLVQAATPSAGGPLAGSRWGHLHLRVTNLDRSERFYRDALGVDVTQRNFPGARFLAADGYHHHLGLNTWGHPRQAQPPGALGLASAAFARRNAPNVERQDPDGITLRVLPLSG